MTEPDNIGALHPHGQQPANAVPGLADRLDPRVPHSARVYAYWLLLAVLHFLADAQDPARVVATLARTLAPGSYLAVSHLTADFAPEEVISAATAYNTLARVPVTPRTHAQVTALLGGHPLVAPGVVRVSEWRPDISGQFGQPADLYAGVARVTGARP